MTMLVAIAAAILVALAPGLETPSVRHMNASKRVRIDAPSTWQARSEEYVLTVSAPAGPTDVFTPTVSIMIEPVSGERKRLTPYVNAYYSNQWLMSENMSGWNVRDTTWDGLPASIAGYTSAYGGGTMVTRVIMAIDGDHAYLSRAMWMDDASKPAIDSALAVLATTARVRPSSK